MAAGWLRTGATCKIPVTPPRCTVLVLGQKEQVLLRSPMLHAATSGDFHQNGGAMAATERRWMETTEQ
jgi:hypothetical protein